MHCLRHHMLRGNRWALLAIMLSPSVPLPRPALEAQAAQPTSVPLSIDIGWTSGAPDARGDGASMTGIGLDAAFRTGIRGTLGPVRYVFIPELLINENRAFRTFGAGDPSRDSFSSPFYFGSTSADLPSRPGGERRVAGAFGESVVWWEDRAAFVGVMTTTPRWGPARPGRDGDASDLPGEGLVLGRSAPGVPRIEFARSWRLPRGVARLRWFGGAVRESSWFDDDDGNDFRSLAGVRAEYARGKHIAVGISRTTMARGDVALLDGALRPFSKARRGTSMEFVAADFVFAHDAAGTIAWVELARQEPVRSAGALLRAPSEGITFRTGLVQRVARNERADWIASVEAVRLDQAGTRTDVVPTDAYTSASVPQGWTHLGQPLGSGLGPGGQRQSASLHRVGRIWTLGAFAERVRWNEDAMLRQAEPASDRHDVTLQGGIAVSRRSAAGEVSARLSAGRRLNYLFQGASSTPDNLPVDLSIVRLGLSFSRSAGTRRILGLPPG